MENDEANKMSEQEIEEWIRMQKIRKQYGQKLQVSKESV